MIPLFCYFYMFMKDVQNTLLVMWMAATSPFRIVRKPPYEDVFEYLTDAQRQQFQTILKKQSLPFELPLMVCTKIVDMSESLEIAFRYVYFYCGDHLVVKETYSPVGFLLIREIFTPDDVWCIRFCFYWNGVLHTRAILKDDELTDVEDNASIVRYNKYGFMESRVWSTPRYGSPTEETYNVYGWQTRSFTVANHKIAHFRMMNVCENLPTHEKHDCAICLNSNDTNEFIRLNKCCNQILHKECFKEWSKRVITCPLCRFDFSEALVID